MGFNMTPIAVKPKTTVKLNQNIEVLEREFMAQEQVKCPVVHLFAPGQYIREVHLPAGAIVIGHHQNFEHLNIFIKGRVAMRNEDGSFIEMKAPMVFTGKPGRKIGYIYEDVIWLNVFVTDETDIEKLEAHFLTKSDAWIKSAAAKDNVLLLQNAVDRRDFETMLKEIGMTKEQVREQSENVTDMVELPYGGYKIKVAKSKIEGRGLFATSDIEPEEMIAPARIKGFRTIAGRFTNHSLSPNARMVRGHDSDIHLVALRKINGCHGGLDGEEITVNYRESVRLTLSIGRVG
jgi:hypothetical protein